jgi:aspartate aminotransferase-like enzyme
MTTRERVDSPVIRRIFEAYRMDDAGIQALYLQIERQLTVVYRQTIQSSLSLYGCQKLVTGPDTQALEFIQTKARQDSTSIANTFDRELQNRIQSIYSGNKRSNRYAYMRALDAWIVQRNAYKTASISLNTMTAARKYAQDRFVKENNIQGRWVLVGPPPVCKKCVRIKALGAVSFEQTQKAQNALPQHVNCPHRYAQLVPKKISCDETTWTG